MPPAPHDDLAAAAARADALERDAALAWRQAAQAIGEAADSPLDLPAEGRAVHAARDAAVHAQRYARAAGELAALASARAEALYGEAAALDARDPFAPPPRATGFQFQRPAVPEDPALDSYYHAAERAAQAAEEAGRHAVRARDARDLADTADRAARQDPAGRAAAVHRARADEAQAAADTLAAEAGQRQLDLSKAEFHADPSAVGAATAALDRARSELDAAELRADALARAAREADRRARGTQAGILEETGLSAWHEQRERAYAARPDVRKGRYPAADRRGQLEAQIYSRLLDLSGQLAGTWDAGTAEEFAREARELSRLLNAPDTRYPSRQEDPREFKAYSRRWHGGNPYPWAPVTAAETARARRDKAASALPSYPAPGSEECFETTRAAIDVARRNVRQLAGLRLDADPGADLRALRIAAARDLWTAALKNAYTPDYPESAIAAARAELLAAVAAGRGQPDAGRITIYERLNPEPLPRPVLDAEQLAEQESARNDRAELLALRATALRADDTAHLTPPGAARDGLLGHAAGLYETAAAMAREHHARAIGRAAAADDRYRRAEPAAAGRALAWAGELGGQAALAGRAAEQLAQAAASARRQAAPAFIPSPRAFPGRAFSALSRARDTVQRSGVLPGRRRGR